MPMENKSFKHLHAEYQEVKKQHEIHKTSLENLMQGIGTNRLLSIIDAVKRKAEERENSPAYKFDVFDKTFTEAEKSARVRRKLMAMIYQRILERGTKF